MIISDNDSEVNDHIFQSVGVTPTVVSRPNDVVPHDIFSQRYWNQLHALGRRINPLRERECKDHAREWIGTMDHGVSRTNALMKLHERPMDTGMWDPNRQYLPDGSIDLSYWG